jgi:hypothetical protein
VKTFLEEMPAADDRSVISLINRVLRQYMHDVQQAQAAAQKKPKAKG